MKIKKRIVFALLGGTIVSSFGIISPPIVNADQSSELILHGNYGGGASNGGVVHSLKYDKEKNEYYVTRNTTGVMNRVSGEKFVTEEMQNSTQKFNETVANRKSQMTDESIARKAADDEIQEKIDGANVLTYDDTSHSSITLGGENGTALFNVKTDENDKTSLANGDYLSKVDTNIAAEREAQQTSIQNVANEREQADAALLDRLGTIVPSKTTHYVDSDNSANENLLALDTQARKNNETLKSNSQHRDELLSAEKIAQQDGDEALWNKLGKLPDGGSYYVSNDESASGNLEILDTKLGEISQNTSNFGKKRDQAVSAEEKARQKADKELSDKIGSISSNTKTNYIDADNSVADNLSNLDSAASDNNQALAEEIQNRQNAIDDITSAFAPKLNDMQNEITATGAKVSAISNLKFGDYGKGQKTSFSIGLGRYGNKTAGALGVKYYFNRDIAMNTAISTGNRKMANAGIAARIRMETPELKELREIKKEMTAVAEDNEKLEQEITLLKIKGGRK